MFHKNHFLHQLLPIFVNIKRDLQEIYTLIQGCYMFSVENSHKSLIHSISVVVELYQTKMI